MSLELATLNYQAQPEFASTEIFSDDDFINEATKSFLLPSSFLPIIANYSNLYQINEIIEFLQQQCLNNPNFILAMAYDKNCQIYDLFSNLSKYKFAKQLNSNFSKIMNDKLLTNFDSLNDIFEFLRKKSQENNLHTIPRSSTINWHNILFQEYFYAGTFSNDDLFYINNTIEKFEIILLDLPQLNASNIYQKINKLVEILQYEFENNFDFINAIATNQHKQIGELFYNIPKFQISRELNRRFAQSICSKIDYDPDTTENCYYLQDVFKFINKINTSSNLIENIKEFVNNEYNSTNLNYDSNKSNSYKYMIISEYIDKFLVETIIHHKDTLIEQAILKELSIMIKNREPVIPSSTFVLRVMKNHDVFQSLPKSPSKRVGVKKERDEKPRKKRRSISSTRRKLSKGNL